MSAVSASRWSAPPPSITTETFGASANCASASARRSSAARGPASMMAPGSSGSGPVRIGTPSEATMPSCSDLGREQRRRARRQSADLQAAARGDLHDAVAVAACRRAEPGEGIDRHRLGRSEPDQQAVPGRHRCRQAGAGAAGRRRAHVASASSGASDASMSLRRGCHHPWRRAASSRAAMARAAAGFSRMRNARTSASPR